VSSEGADAQRARGAVCLGNKYNPGLASQSFPVRAVHDVGKSFHETVERLRSSPALIAATQPRY
jgi:hypothetical protein